MWTKYGFMTFADHCIMSFTFCTAPHLYWMQFSFTKLTYCFAYSSWFRFAGIKNWDFSIVPHNIWQNESWDPRGESDTSNMCHQRLVTTVSQPSPVPPCASSRKIRRGQLWWTPAVSHLCQATSSIAMFKTEALGIVRRNECQTWNSCWTEVCRGAGRTLALAELQTALWWQCPSFSVVAFSGLCHIRLMLHLTLEILALRRVHTDQVLPLES